MKTQVLLPTVLAALMAVYSADANAAAILVVTDTSTFSLSCNNSLPFTATNCGAGFNTSANSNTIVFSGIVGGFSITSASITGNQPGSVSAVAGFVASSVLVTRISGTGNLQIDYGGNNFTLPPGPDLVLSASGSAALGQSQATDVMNFQSWVRADNALTIPGGTATAIMAPCVPGEGLTTSCSGVTTDVPFLRGAGAYSLTARQVITQSTLDTLGASYNSTVAASVPPTTVPEPGTVVLLGAGLLLVAFRQRVGNRD